MTPALRTLTRCLVCGFAEVRTDEVIDRGVVLLSECPRCAHRTTWRPATRELIQPVSWPIRPAATRVAAARAESVRAA